MTANNRKVQLFNQRQRMVQAALKSEEGLKILAKSMTQPLRFYQDYSSVGRSAIMVETLKQGQDPILDTDVTGGDLAYIVTDLGLDVSKVVKLDSVRIQTKEIASNPIITYDEVASAKYDIKTRVETKVRAEVFRKEDAVIFQALMAASLHSYKKLDFQTLDLLKPINLGGQEEVRISGEPVNAPILVNRSSLSIETLSAAMANIERWGGLKPTNLYMNAVNVQILRKMNSAQTGYFVDFDTSKEIMKTGFVANVYGLNVYTTPVIPENVIMITAEPEFVGRVVERIPLTVIPYDKPEQRAFAFAIFLNSGYFIHNPRAVAAIQIT